MCSETSEAVGTTWESAQLEFQKFLKIRITLPKQVGLMELCSDWIFQLISWHYGWARHCDTLTVRNTYLGILNHFSKLNTNITKTLPSIKTMLQICGQCVSIGYHLCEKGKALASISAQPVHVAIVWWLFLCHLLQIIELLLPNFTQFMHSCMHEALLRMQR